MNARDPDFIIAMPASGPKNQGGEEATRAQMNVELIGPEELTPDLEQIWTRFRRSNAALSHPYFDIRFTQAASAVPGAQVAIVYEGESICGFFPVQRRRGLYQPLAAPMSDYHGVIAPSRSKICPQQLVELLGGTLSAGAWSGAPVPGFVPRERMAARVGGGAEALQRRLDQKNRKFWKNMARKARRLEEELGPARFNWNDDDPAVFDWLISAKRAQYARTRRHDIFSCGWTVDLLAELKSRHADGYGLRIASLRAASGELLAAEASLDDGRTLHLWFPVYAPAYRRFGPGMYLTWLQMLRAADDGYAEVDFGCGAGDYKSTLADVAGYAWEGTVAGEGATVRALARLINRKGPAPLRRFGTSLKRRLDIINACEVTPAGWMTGAAAAAWAMVRS
ncbi:MAG: GNAT family N-acetyltransferase [Caulobacterales bacterium]|nr:GNAT family N-acetyltransferase [Caulobacterales bacterium]